jgi:hypothetical protein
MLKTAIFVCAASMLLVTPGQARFKKPGIDKIMCDCTCILGSGVSKRGLYDPKSTSCTILERRTCNIEIPGTPIVASGELAACVRKDQLDPSTIMRADSKPRRPKGVPSDAVMAPSSR